MIFFLGFEKYQELKTHEGRFRSHIHCSEKSKIAEKYSFHKRNFVPPSVLWVIHSVSQSSSDPLSFGNLQPHSSSVRKAGKQDNVSKKATRSQKVSQDGKIFFFRLYLPRSFNLFLVSQQWGVPELLNGSTVAVAKDSKQPSTRRALALSLQGSQTRPAFYQILFCSQRV